MLAPLGCQQTPQIVGQNRQKRGVEQAISAQPTGQRNGALAASRRRAQNQMTGKNAHGIPDTKHALPAEGSPFALRVGFTAPAVVLQVQALDGRRFDGTARQEATWQTPNRADPGEDGGRPPAVAAPSHQEGVNPAAEAATEGKGQQAQHAAAAVAGLPLHLARVGRPMTMQP